MNKVILIGRLTKDPEVKTTNNGVAMCRFTIAVNRDYKTNGERQADFISCIAWRETANNLAKYQRKGNQIAVDGSVQVTKYTDNNGVTKYSTDIVCNSVSFLESKNNSPAAAQAHSSPGVVSPYDYMPDTQQPASPENITESYDVSNDDLPF